jgi:hypothetical protein
LPPTAAGETPSVLLRRLLWTGLYAALAALAAMVAKRVASGVWRIATGEKPPAKR